MSQSDSPTCPQVGPQAKEIDAHSGIEGLLSPLRRLHDQVRDEVTAACERSAVEDLARVDDDSSEGDRI